MKKTLAAAAALALAAPAYAGPVLMTDEEMERTVAGDITISFAGIPQEVIVSKRIEGFVNIVPTLEGSTYSYCISGPRFTAGNACAQ